MATTMLRCELPLPSLREAAEVLSSSAALSELLERTLVEPAGYLLPWHELTPALALSQLSPYLVAEELSVVRPVILTGILTGSHTEVPIAPRIVARHLDPPV
jgi:hypothetical protein